MKDFKSNMINIPPAILFGLKPYLLLEFYDYPFLTVDVNYIGTKFLNYYVDGASNELSHVIIEVSNERLDMVLNNGLSLHEAFSNPENEIVYLANFNVKGDIESLNLLDIAFFKSNNPIPMDYEVEYVDEVIYEETTLTLRSHQRNTIMLDVYLQANNLKSSLKLWAFKSFLMPFSDLVRTSLLDNSNQFNTYTLDKGVNIGFNKLQLNSLSTTLELNFNSDLFGNSKELEGMINLFDVLSSNDEKSILESFEKFNNKKVISEYLKILNAIIKNDASLKTKLAAPNDYFSETSIDKNKATLIRSIINEKIPNVEDVEEIKGYLLELSFDKLNHTFSMNASEEELKYKGKIAPELENSIGKKEFVFMTKEYVFKIHTLYVPGTSKSPERYTRTLIDITEVTEES